MTTNIKFYVTVVGKYGRAEMLELLAKVTDKKENGKWQEQKQKKNY